MKSFEQIARDLVAKWEHGDDAHRQWLREIAVPDIVEALRSVCDPLRIAANDRTTVRATVHDAVMVDPSKMTVKEVEALVTEELTLVGKRAPHLAACPAEHVRHDDVLYPAWLKVRTVLQGSEYDYTKTCGDIADAIVEALRKQLTNDTTELTKRLHDGAAAAGWDVVLRAFVALAHDSGISCVLERLESEATRDGWRLTHALIVELPTGQVSWRVTDAEAAALSFRCYVPFSDRHTWDGHTREEKYKRLEQFSRMRRR